MRYLKFKNTFKKERILMQKRGKSLSELDSIIVLLANDTPLPPSMKDHPLSGTWANFRECHIQPDWLLIYQKSDTEDNMGLLLLEATGTHSDLFG